MCVDCPKPHFDILKCIFLNVSYSLKTITFIFAVHHWEVMALEICVKQWYHQIVVKTSNWTFFSSPKALWDMKLSALFPYLFPFLFLLNLFNFNHHGLFSDDYISFLFNFTKSLISICTTHFVYKAFVKWTCWQDLSSLLFASHNVRKEEAERPFCSEGTCLHVPVKKMQHRVAGDCSY